MTVLLRERGKVYIYICENYKYMKKQFVAAAALISIVACNSNSDKQAENPTKKIDSAAAANNISPADDTGTGLLSGKFEVVEYKKDNIKIEVPKAIYMFTKKGKYIKPDGSILFYKIEGDSLLIMADEKLILAKSRIEFLNPEKTSFIVKESPGNMETTYKKITQ